MTPDKALTERPGLPCPSHVRDTKTGEWIYCEQGDKGHRGTCCGGRSVAEYRPRGHCGHREVGCVVVTPTSDHNGTPESEAIAA